MRVEILSGHDMRDSTSLSEKVPNYSSALERKDLKGITVGIPKVGNHILPYNL